MSLIDYRESVYAWQVFCGLQTRPVTWVRRLAAWWFGTAA